ncbi:hypothetical protein IM511_07140 [Erythrobacteraceae bacterium E2-1 Yellow Sea]|nr:hypothetical protein [Erythrobacteraceae bacterium E2-1 Yellow Sea]
MTDAEIKELIGQSKSDAVNLFLNIDKLHFISNIFAVIVVIALFGGTIYLMTHEMAVYGIFFFLGVSFIMYIQYVKSVILYSAMKGVANFLLIDAARFSKEISKD